MPHAQPHLADVEPEVAFARICPSLVVWWFECLTTKHRAEGSRERLLRSVPTTAPETLRWDNQSVRNFARWQRLAAIRPGVAKDGESDRKLFNRLDESIGDTDIQPFADGSVRKPLAHEQPSPVYRCPQLILLECDSSSPQTVPAGSLVFDDMIVAIRTVAPQNDLIIRKPSVSHLETSANDAMPGVAPKSYESIANQCEIINIEWAPIGIELDTKFVRTG